ncbi:hypothetical protein [Pseudomonas defluvii]|uniref:hypothetical protein n=1 Tax=Pseudomonas defluvii TaxID=1876757 RepID=UPI003906282B
MCFELLCPSVGYQEHARASGEQGFCYGMSYLWIKGVVSGEIKNLRQPVFAAAQKEQRKYETFLVSRKDRENILYQYFDFQRNTELCSINSSIAKGNAAANDMVNALASSPGNVAVLVGWHCIEKNPADSTGHATALARLNGVVYFYDPNRGFFKWKQTPGATLVGDLVHYMTKVLRYSPRAELIGALECKPAPQKR